MSDPVTISDAQELREFLDRKGHIGTSLKWSDLENGEFYWLLNRHEMLPRSIFQYQRTDSPHEPNVLQSIAVHTQYTESDVEAMVESGMTIHEVRI